jgi:hypothetical protein
MAILFNTPIPLVLALVGLLILSSPQIFSKRWAKIGRWLCLGFLGFFLLTALQWMNAKGTVGLRKSDAHSITVFTTEISRLVKQGENEKARELLEKFNNEYPAVSGQDEAKKFLENLTEEARRK